MTTLRTRTLLMAALLIFLGASYQLLAQGGGPSGREAPDIPVVTRALAVTDARIVVRPGKVIDRGTVVMRDGLIVAVGRDAAVPFDAKVIDGTGMTVYAGFIDGYSWAGAPKPGHPSDSGVKAGDPPDEVAGITPQRDIRDIFNRQDGFIDSLRRAGFAVAHTLPRGGMLPGTGAVMLLGGRDTSRFFLRGDASVVATFEGADDVYPATPMGIMAKFRNLYRQAEQLQEMGNAFRGNPNGYERPMHDRVRETFFGPINGDVPVMFVTGDDLEVRRAMKLSSELGFPLVLAGLKEGHDVAQLIKDRGTPLFLSLNFPEKIEEKKDSADADSLSGTTSTVLTTEQFADENQKVLDHTDLDGEHLHLVTVRDEARRAAVETPEFFNRIGTRFGFGTAGAAGKDIRPNLIEAVSRGLPEDAALAALTIEPARMIGMEKVLGTVERGMAANLVLTSGPYFSDTSRVMMTVVDGMTYDYREEKSKEEKMDSADKESDADAATEHLAQTGDPIAAPGELVDARRDKSGNILIRNGTVLTVTDGTLEETDVLVRNGKIASIGKGLSAPGGTTVVDATGKFVMPGIIDAHSHIAVSGPVNEWTNPVTAEVQIEDVLDPYDITIYRALAGGVTVSHVMHGSANPIGGQCETIKHRYGETDPELLKMEGAPRTIKFALGENPTRVHGQGYGVPPFTRMGVEQSFRRAFSEAERYMEEQDEYARSKDRGERVAPPRYDLRLETLADILRGEIIIHCHSYRADEILMLMDVLKDFGVNRITFQHVNEGFKVAPELAEFGAMASVFSDWWAYKFEVYYSTAYNASILTQNGVTTSINSDSPELNRHLYHEAAKSMRNGGLTEEQCLAMITINPAKQLGIEDRVGSIETGKEGDLAIFDGHPLSVYARPVMTIVDGVIRFDAENDPDDMRLHVDPEERIGRTTLYDEHGDRCMEGVQ